MTSAYALQEAIYAHLTSDTALMEKLIGVFDHVPQEAQYPYLYFGDASVSRERLSVMEVETVSLDVHIASASQSRGEVDALAQSVTVLLHHQVNLNVTGYHVARMQLNQPEIKRTKEGLGYQAKMVLRAVLTEI